MVTPMPAGPIGSVAGTAMAVRGDDIDTDRIMPARFLRALTFEGLGEHVFEDDRRFAASAGEVHPFDDPAHAAASLLVVNRNFGCGSSREHAPQGLLRRGIRALVGESFSEIFFGNATMVGMPCVRAEAGHVEALMRAIETSPQIEVAVDLRTLTVRTPGRSAPISLPASVRDAFLDGSWDATGLLLEDYDRVRSIAAGLPYMRSFDPGP